MHLFDRLRTSVRRKPNVCSFQKIELTLSQQIENLFHRSNTLADDHRLQFLRLIYEYRSREFNTLNIPLNDSKRMEFERSMLKSLVAITSNLPPKLQSSFQRSSPFYRSMPTATSTHVTNKNNLLKYETIL
jgi:hypothetical protein